MDITNEAIEELRAAFLQRLTENSSEVYHMKDVERVKENDKWLKRFLLHKENKQDEALKMLWDTVLWRKESRVNDIQEMARFDLLNQGGFFPYGRDCDGHALFVFKCKEHVKGAHSIEDLKICVIYWFEYLEKETNGEKISLFFDLEGCGLRNLDLGFTQYLIGLFQQYYPYFLNYILMFEMHWIMNTSLKLIKSWLPEKAVQKMHHVSKKNICEFVTAEDVLTCWGGSNDFEFRFEPSIHAVCTSASSATKRISKVHFADGESPSTTNTNLAINSANMADGLIIPNRNNITGEGVLPPNATGSLVVHPQNVLLFNDDNNSGELVSNVELWNTDPAIILSYKLKTTSPEKFRVRPSVGILHPNAKATIQVTLLTGFQLGGLTRDKFLVMTTVLEPTDVQNVDLNVLWKDTAGRKTMQHRLKCAQSNPSLANNNNNNINYHSNEMNSAVVDGSFSSMATMNSIGGGSSGQLLAQINRLIRHEENVQKMLYRLHYMLVFIAVAIVFLGIGLLWILHEIDVDDVHHQGTYCVKHDLHSD